MNQDPSEILPFLQAKKLAGHRFMGACRRHETPGSETKDFKSHVEAGLGGCFA